MGASRSETLTSTDVLSSPFGCPNSVSWHPTCWPVSTPSSPEGSGWRWPAGLALVTGGIFLVVDFAFFAANLFKIQEGGWIPLTFGTLVFIVMVSWHFGFEAMRHGHAVLNETPDEFFRRLKESRV